MLAWDRSHDWVLQRHWHDLTRVTIRFRRGSPSVAELVAVRRCLPQFREMVPASVRALIGDSGELRLGEMPTPDAQPLIGAAQSQGLEVVAEGASFVSYLPYDRTTGCAWLIEDEREAADVAHAMLAAAVPVEEVVEQCLSRRGARQLHITMMGPADVPIAMRRASHFAEEGR